METSALAHRIIWSPLFVGLLAYFVVSTQSISVNDCHSVRYAYLAKGLDLKDVPKQPRQGSQLEICPRGLTCCTEEMEKKLRSVSKDQYGKAVASAADSIRRFFGSRSGKFDGVFPALMERSKLEFHHLFRDTYGIIYIKNSDVFIDFFKDLESYYDHGNVNLEEALKRFFTFLYQRMFTVYNHQFKFDARYLTCVSQTMKELQPFGDVPKQLTEQLRRSFVATRTFNEALVNGKKIMNKMIKIQPKDKCVVALTKMSSCPACEGFGEIRPCNDYCVNVMKGCLAYHADLGASWDKFIENIQALADRLLGPFNIEDVVDPIGIKISEAIMNFQRSGFDVTQKIYASCGTPRIAKRGAHDGLWSSRSGRQTKNQKQRRRNNQKNKGKGSSKLNDLIRDVRETVGGYKGFWSGLPYALCKDSTMGGGSNKHQGERMVDEDHRCWNGKGAGEYTNNVVSDGFSQQGLNPEVEVDTSRPNVAVQEQILALRAISKQLNNAIRGQNVEWHEAADEGYRYYDGGSGDGGCDSNSDDEDCFDSNVLYEEGSGSGNDGHGDEETHYPPDPEMEIGNDFVTNSVGPTDMENDSNSDIYPNELDDDEDEYVDNWPPWVTESSDGKDENGLTVIDTNEIDDQAQHSQSDTSSAPLPIVCHVFPFIACLVGSIKMWRT